ncbi:hypothetical protein NDR87_24675 [Nocardia sp. CDC159]|uniref:Lipoprotein n=1 Tax=Nocardia pulmonis TaxID=2951408 RepID=A0A9X2E8P8_9NOCA|nr:MULTISPECIES: hypothetical protein [Nocardia]MCM6775098.1 hypothetical protein [Nocardia pulmonis]MCM6789568.1 hypothetical protein [Nocardia sp. CDC159]
MRRPAFRALALLVLTASALAGCSSARHPTTETGWTTGVDVGAVDRVLASATVQQLTGSFLRAHPTPGSEDATLHRVGPPVLVYAVDPKFVGNPSATMRDAGIPSYIAVPVRIGARTTTDTLQLAAGSGYDPRAIATGTEEEEAARTLPAGTRLLLDYPSHTWFGWSETRVTAIRSGIYTDLRGREFDLAGFEHWLTVRQPIARPNR